MSSLDLLIRLKDGWYGKESRAISPKAVSCYVQLVQAFDEFPLELEPMGLPRADGGILMEWSKGDSIFMIEIYNNGHAWIYREDNEILAVNEYFIFDYKKIKYFIEQGGCPYFSKPEGQVCLGGCLF